MRKFTPFRSTSLRLLAVVALACLVGPARPQGPPRFDDLREMDPPITAARLQEELAKSDNRALLQTRLDRVYFAYDLKEPDKPTLQLRFVGVCLDSRCEDVARKNTLLQGPLGDAFFKAYPALKRVDAQPTVELIKAIESPVYALQQTVAKEINRRLDGMVFLPATYDKDGILQFPVRRVEREAGQDAEARQLVKDFWERNREHACFRSGRSGSPYTVTPQEGGPLQPKLQDLLADPAPVNPPARREVRLDRVWFDYAAKKDGELELHCKGIYLLEPEDLKKLVTPDQDPGPAADVGLFLQREVGRLWGVNEKEWWIKEVTPRLKGGVRARAHPGSSLQRAVASLTVKGKFVLDGVRTYRADKPKSYASEFTNEGKLVVHGEWRGVQQRDVLRELVKDYSKNQELREHQEDRLDRNGLVLRMAVYRTDDVLDKLHQYAANGLEDVLLQRVYFDPNGVPKLVGNIPEHLEADLKRDLKREFEVRMKVLEPEVPRDSRGRGRRGVLVASARWLPDLHALLMADEKPELELKPVRGLTQYLRTRLQAPRAANAPPPPEAWDGIWLKRGFYVDGNYVVAGYLGYPPQRDQLDVLLQELNAGPDAAQWRDQLPNGWELDRLQVMPLAPMIERLRVVMPAYPDLDRLTLQRAFHDVTGVLVLRVGVVGRAHRDAAVAFKRLLDAHPDWKARSEIGVRLQEAARPTPSEPRVVEESLLNAVKNLKYMCVEPALELTTTAILHDPEDSTGWYLRALCHLLKKDTEQAERDLRRTVLLEREGPRYPGPRANLRLERMELLQNTYRQMLEAGRRKVLNDVEAGKPPPPLAPAK